MKSLKKVLITAAVAVGMFKLTEFLVEHDSALNFPKHYARCFQEGTMGPYKTRLLGNLLGYYTFLRESFEDEGSSPVLRGTDLTKKSGVDGKIDTVWVDNLPEGHPLQKYANKDSLQKAYDDLLQGHMNTCGFRKFLSSVGIKPQF